MSVTMATFAPRDRHESACDTIFCGSFNAFVIEYVTFAFFRAFAKSGASNCCQRTDDFVSGSSTHTWILADCLAAALPARMTPVTTARTATTPTVPDLRDNLLTPASSMMAFHDFSSESG